MNIMAVSSPAGLSKRLLASVVKSPELHSEKVFRERGRPEIRL